MIAAAPSRDFAELAPLARFAELAPLATFGRHSGVVKGPPQSGRDIPHACPDGWRAPYRPPPPRDNRRPEHDPEKWVPVFGQDHAQRFLTRQSHHECAGSFEHV